MTYLLWRKWKRSHSGPNRKRRKDPIQPRLHPRTSLHKSNRIVPKKTKTPGRILLKNQTTRPRTEKTTPPNQPNHLTKKTSLNKKIPENREVSGITNPADINRIPEKQTIKRIISKKINLLRTPT